MDGCTPVNLLHIFRKSFPRSTSGGLLLWGDSIYFSTPRDPLRENLIIDVFLRTKKFRKIFQKNLALSIKANLSWKSSLDEVLFIDSLEKFIIQSVPTN